MQVGPGTRLCSGDRLTSKLCSLTQERAQEGGLIINPVADLQEFQPPSLRNCTNCAEEIKESDRTGCARI